MPFTAVQNNISRLENLHLFEWSLETCHDFAVEWQRQVTKKSHVLIENNAHTYVRTPLERGLHDYTL